MLDVSEQKTYSLELTDGLPRHGPPDWDKDTKDERSVFRFYRIYSEQSTRTPMKTRTDSSKHSEAIRIRDAGRNPQFFWTIFPDKNTVMDSPFCSWTVRSAENRTFWRNFSSPTDDFGGSTMRGYCLGRNFGGVPIFALDVCVSTFDWRFLLWAVNNHLNKKPSRTALQTLCTLYSRGRLLGCTEQVAERSHCSSLKGNGHKPLAPQTPIPPSISH